MVFGSGTCRVPNSSMGQESSASRSPPDVVADGCGLRASNSTHPLAGTTYRVLPYVNSDPGSPSNRYETVEMRHVVRERLVT